MATGRTATPAWTETKIVARARTMIKSSAGSALTRRLSAACPIKP